MKGKFSKWIVLALGGAVLSLAQSALAGPITYLSEATFSVSATASPFTTFEGAPTLFVDAQSATTASTGDGTFAVSGPAVGDSGDTLSTTISAAANTNNAVVTSSSSVNYSATWYLFCGINTFCLDVFDVTVDWSLSASRSISDVGDAADAVATMSYTVTQLDFFDLIIDDGDNDEVGFGDAFPLDVLFNSPTTPATQTDTDSGSASFLDVLAWDDFDFFSALAIQVDLTVFGSGLAIDTTGGGGDPVDVPEPGSFALLLLGLLGLLAARRVQFA